LARRPNSETAHSASIQPLDPALVLEAVQRRIQRSLVHLQHVFGDLLDPVGDRPAVQRLPLQRAEDQQVERSGQEIGRLASAHRVGSRH
jgi:hypothetical protein